MVSVIMTREQIAWWPSSAVKYLSVNFFLSEKWRWSVKCGATMQTHPWHMQTFEIWRTDDDWKIWPRLFHWPESGFRQFDAVSQQSVRSIRFGCGWCRRIDGNVGWFRRGSKYDNANYWAQGYWNSVILSLESVNHILGWMIGALGLWLWPWNLWVDPIRCLSDQNGQHNCTRWQFNIWIQREEGELKHYFWLKIEEFVINWMLRWNTSRFTLNTVVSSKKRFLFQHHS